MDPRQMVALRKALGGAEEVGEQAAPEAPPAMPVQCPGCGEQFDANAPEAQAQNEAPPVA